MRIPHMHIALYQNVNLVSVSCDELIRQNLDLDYLIKLTNVTVYLTDDPGICLHTYSNYISVHSTYEQQNR
jgi:hypothetical protein